MQEYCWLGLSIPLGEEKICRLKISPSSGLNFTVGNVDVKKQDTFELDCNFKIKHLMFTVCSRTIQSTCIYGCRSYFFSARAFCEYWQFWQCHKTCSVQHSRHTVLFFGEKETKRTNTQERWCCQYPCGLPGVHRRSATQTQQDFSTAD